MTMKQAVLVWFSMPLLAVPFMIGCGPSRSQHSNLPHQSVPGEINPEINQGNIQTTICVPGWTKTIRPRVTYTTKLKLQQINTLGLTGQASDFEEDHRVPLELGGDPADIANLWPEPWPEARQKDKLETALHRDVCAERVTLAYAQSVFLGDYWVEYEKRYGPLQ